MKDSSKLMNENNSLNSNQKFKHQESMVRRQFVEKLQKQAKVQSQLERKRILPRKVDSLTSLIARYPWQTLLLLSLLTTIALEVFF